MNNSSVLKIGSIIQVLDQHFMEGGISETYLQPSKSEYQNVYMGGHQVNRQCFACLLSKYLFLNLSFQMVAQPQCFISITFISLP